MKREAIIICQEILSIPIQQNCILVRIHFAQSTACVDLIYKQKNDDGASLVKRIESRNGLLTLEYAEEINLGNRSYQLKKLE